jgi:predicted nucleotidyltransferase
MCKKSCVSTLLGKIIVMKTAFHLTPAEIDKYRRASLKVRILPNKDVHARRLRAWRVARKAAKILRAEFGVKKIVAFGSLLHPKLFHSKSDIDLAVWDIPTKEYYRAISLLLDIDPTISVDLINIEDAKPALKKIISEEGKEI